MIELLAEYWYLLPLSIAIATLAMATGIGGAVFFSPLFMIGLDLSPHTAVGAALLTELFGFASGLFAYVRAKLIDYNLGLNLLIVSIPLALLGAYFSDAFPDTVVKTIFGVGIIVIGSQLYTAYRNEKKERQNLKNELAESSEEEHNRCLVDSQGNTYRYTIKQRWLGRTFASVGGFFIGLISVGLAEILEYRLVAQCRVPPPVAVASSIFVVVVTILMASGFHAYTFLTHADADTYQKVGSIVLFTIPGVVVGGQIGPMLQKLLNPETMKLFIAGLFSAVGIFMLVNTLVIS
jgi:uncharacterized membrane protein YfcA